MTLVKENPLLLKVGEGGGISLTSFFINILDKNLLLTDFRSERTLSVGRAVSLLGRFAPLRGLTCPAHPTGVAALHSNQLRVYRNISSNKYRKQVRFPVE